MGIFPLFGLYISFMQPTGHLALEILEKTEWKHSLETTSVAKFVESYCSTRNTGDDSDLDGRGGGTSTERMDGTSSDNDDQDLYG